MLPQQQQLQEQQKISNRFCTTSITIGSVTGDVLLDFKVVAARYEQK